MTAHPFKPVPSFKYMKLLCLLSGGIDSPVAAYLMQNQGCEVVLVHFQPANASGDHKIIQLAQVLAKHKGKPIKIYLVPFKSIQYELIKTVSAQYRMIAYRRAMLRIADLIKEKESAEGIITGDSLGQVASQTVENLHCIYSATKTQILTPLIGTDKKDIMNLAKKIGTYELSIIPYEDCCSFLNAPHPVTKARLDNIEAQETDLTQHMQECLSLAMVQDVQPEAHQQTHNEAPAQQPL